MSIFKQDSDTRSRLEIVEKLGDETKLVEVACTDDSPRVRLLAISKIESDQKLFKVVNNSKELDVKLMAVERISSEQMVADIVKVPKNLELVGMCFSRITDRKIIAAIAEDASCNPVVRKLAVEHFADESYLSDVYEAKTGRKSEKAVNAIVDWHGGGLKGVRAIGRFKRSTKALKALGTIAQKAGEEGELAVEYLCKALGSSNRKLADVAMEELANIENPQLVSILVGSLDDPGLAKPVRSVLLKIDTPQARDALGLSKQN